MPDEKKTAPKPAAKKGPQPIRLGKAIHLTLSDEKSRELRDVAKAGVSQSDLVKACAAEIGPPVIALRKALEGLNVRQIAKALTRARLEQTLRDLGEDKP